MRLNEALAAYISHDLRLHIWTCIGVAVLAIVLIYLLDSLRDKRKKLRGLSQEMEGTERALDSAIRSNGRQMDEVQSWRRFFGPFPSLYENSPECDAGGRHNDTTIAIDLDGVILEYVEPWNGVAHFGKPIPGTAEAIQKLKNLGYTIVIYTTRNNSMACHNSGHNALELTALVQAKLEDFKIPYDFIALFKPLARYYIDDRAVRFSGDWQNTLADIGNMECDRLNDREMDICDALNNKEKS